MASTEDGRQLLGITLCSILALVGTGCGNDDDQPGVGGIVERSVAFHVKNTNTSGLACHSDGADYTVRGHLVGRQSALEGGMPRTVMLYLSGFDTAEWTWHLKDVAGYDYATEMAQLGHVSLTVDMLGYGASDHPPGEQICLGSQADVTHQLITQLRSAQYTVDGGTPLAFSKVALAAHDVGGPVAEIEAYSYKDVDGLVLTEWVDAVGTPFILAILQSRTAFCLAGGEDIQPGGPGGYVFFGPPDEEFRSDLFHQADPAVVDAVVRLRSRNPCGYVLSLVPAIVNDGQKLGEITAPVLFLHPAEDPVWDRSAAEKQPQLFKGSTDVTAMFLDDTGHFPMFERTAPQFRATVSDWLQRRGF